jgi:hypothetical protein
VKKWVGLVLVAGLSTGLLVGCGASPDVSTGGSNNVATTAKKADAPKKDDGTKKFTANASATEFGMKVNIADIKISADKIEVGMNIQNTGKEKMTWFPDQDAKIVVGDMQLDSNMFMEDGKLGGDIEAGVKKDGVLVFPAPDGKKLDVAKITQIKLNCGELNTPDYSDSKEIRFDIPVK